jgi:hypothetical protein
MGERPSEYKRDPDDFYVEPAWSVQVLKNRVHFAGDIHDPCCGSGTIPDLMGGTGADLRDRGYGYPVRDYLRDNAHYLNIVTNPPYGIAQKVIEHALDRSLFKVAALVQLKFLASQGRNELFNRPELDKVIILSRRPSMPPGEMLRDHGEKIRGNGSIDFCWVVFDKFRPVADPTVEWAL